MRIAVIQMVSSAKVESSLSQAENLISDAKSAEVDAIFLPENFASLGNSAPREVAETEATKSPIQSFLAESARHTNSWVFGGTVPLMGTHQDPRVKATSLVFDEQGSEVGRYDKIHMFDVDVADEHRHYRESDTFAHGDRLTLVQTPWAKVGLSVCYDIRFSELYLSLFKQGAEVFSIPSAFTVPTGEAHFKLLMRARAVESFAFTVAACQGGAHDSGRQTYGHSMVVNPWGEVIAKAGIGEDVLIVDLDLAEVERARAALPVLDQRRL